MKYKNKHFESRFVSIVLVICIVTSLLSGCDSSKHLEMEYEENTNDSISNWEDTEEDNVSDWNSSAVVTTWNDVDDYYNWVYSEILFDDITDEYPVVECEVLDYKSNGVYFDGDKIYSLVNDKFDVNSFVAKYAVGTGVIVICVVLNIATAGTTTPFACFIAGASNGAISGAVKGAAFRAAMKAVSTAISSEGDLEDVLYGALEGSADGYMWGAIYGAITGGLESECCFVEGTTITTSDGKVPIEEVEVGNQVLAYSEEKKLFENKTVTQVVESETNETIKILAGNDLIESTPNHLYWNGDSWEAAKDLVVGENLLGLDGKIVTIDKIESTYYENPIKTYNLCVEYYHSYLVGNNSVVVHNNCKINGQYAGKTKYLDDPELAAKYPDGVPFNDYGYPDFSAYAKETVTFDNVSQEALNADTCLNGNYAHDFKMANEACGFNETPSGYTWHHKEDGRTMELIATELHQAIRHTGGVSVIKEIISALA